MRTLLVVSCLAMFGFIATAEAHFKLNAPPALSTQSAMYGDPQKDAPCGPAMPFTPNNMVTEVQSGAMLTISITETVSHNGHYRVAVAQNMAGLPDDPPVTPGTTDCGSVPIDANPMLPLLGDGLLRHTSTFPNPTQTMQVMIPAGMTCTNCILQVTQFMYPHNDPCFYYHCARVNISPNAPPPPPPGDGGIDPGGDAGMDGGGGGGGGGGCNAGGEPAAGGLLGGLVVGLLLLLRRRRR